ncbi:MAG: helix-turn-helix domain-containing protein [Victivallaceae bacterium]|nr:helix-turn-helix domain-containing protein [Victivallaceae bacterium]
MKKSQKDVAATAGISAAALSQIEKPGSTQQQATIKKLAEAMAIKSEQLTSEAISKLSTADFYALCLDAQHDSSFRRSFITCASTTCI